jgi:hypothetical protein
VEYAAPVLFSWQFNGRKLSDDDIETRKKMVKLILQSYLF